jgi:hypothetical protein
MFFAMFGMYSTKSLITFGKATLGTVAHFTQNILRVAIIHICCDE